MGITIYTEGDQIRTRQAAWLVLRLCNGPNHTPEGLSRDYAEFRDTIGVVDVPSEICVKALENAPKTYQEAKEKDLLDDSSTERDFRIAYAFLEAAAKSKDGISGSY